MKYEAIIETKSIRRGWVILTSRLLNSVYAALRVLGSNSYISPVLNLDFCFS